jgi:hypothetical protein
MNKKRNNLIQSQNHNIKITPYWLLGLIEPLLLVVQLRCGQQGQQGEGSFFVTKKNLTQHF